MASQVCSALFEYLFGETFMNNRIPFRSGRGKYFKYVVIVFVILALAFVAKNLFGASDSPKEITSKLQLKEVIASKQLDKDVLIPLKDESGEQAEPVVMKIENVELRDEIIVQGQKATSVAGRSFFVVNIKLVNSLEQAVEINTRDYLRLGENGDGQWLAPDIHNDPVLVQAISTKPTRVAFPVNANVRNFRLQIGEIAGEKEVLEIAF